MEIVNLSKRSQYGFGAQTTWPATPGRVDPKLAKRNPDKAIENQRDALDEERMKVLRSKFVARLTNSHA